jgi:hypothetical protein
MRKRTSHQVRCYRPMLRNLTSASAVLAVACILLNGCRAPETHASPSIEFSNVPRADAGGPETRADIGGRVIGARAGQQIVLFARSGVGVWWVQPLADHPFTAIESNSKWKNSTHLGPEYAALLVESGYRPPTTMTVLPGRGGPIAAVATVKGEGSPHLVSRTLHFSGYEWEIRQVSSDRGGTFNTYDPANAWTDVNGWLHLRIALAHNGFTCAEVILTRSLGYGSYRFVVHESSHLEPAAVLDMFTWDDFAPDQNHREVDVEISQWGDADGNNAQYVVQPFYVPANVVRFMTPPGVVTHSFHWEPGSISFKSAIGGAAGRPSRVVSEHVFTSGVPSPGGESVHMNLYRFDNKKNPLRDGSEVVIEKFEYLP